MRLSHWVRRLEDFLATRRSGAASAPRDPHQARIDDLRARGVQIGSGCWILTPHFSTEPWLIEIGNRVAIAGGVQFVTHEAGAWLLREQHPNLQVFGRIRIGDGCIIGMNAILLPGTTIGPDCLVGAGAVVKGEVPEGSVVVGNPARVIKTTQAHLRSLVEHPHRLDIWHLDTAQRERILKHHFEIDTPASTHSLPNQRPVQPLR